MIRRLLNFVKPFKNKLCKAIILGSMGHIFAVLVVLGMLSSAFAFIEKPVILTFTQGIVLSLVSALLRAFCRYGEQKANHDIAFRILAYIRTEIFKSLRKLAPAKLETKDKGNIISTITSDIELLEVFFAHTLSPIIIAIITSIVFSIYLGFIHPIFALISFIGYMMMAVVLPKYMHKHLQSSSSVQREALGKISGDINQIIDSRYELLQFNQDKNYINIIDEESNNLIKSQNKSIKINSINMAIIQAIVLIASTLALVSGLFLRLPIENTLVAAILILSSFGPTVALSQLANVLPLTFASANRVFKLLDEEPVVGEVVNNSEVNYEKGEVVGVTFAYGEDTILKNIDLKLRSNSIIGIKGESGSGKSTLLKLIMRFYDPTSGYITLNNVNVKFINSDNLRENITYFTQESFFFSLSILDNLRIAKSNATLEDCRKVCKLCNIDEDIMKLDNSYDTVLNFKDLCLSSGQLQRLALSRSLLSEAKLILLDEPTSNIDSLSEAIILDTLSKLKDKTILIVSHRESSLKNCDTIIDIENKKNL